MNATSDFQLREICHLDRQVIDPDSDLAKQLPYLGLEQIESGTGRINTENTSPMGQGGASATFRFDARHVLYGKLRPYLNKVALPNFEGRCTTEIMPLLPFDHIDREYLALILRSERIVSAATRFSTGSRMPRADIEKLLSFEVEIPSLEIQRERVTRFRDKFMSMEDAIHYTKAQIQDSSLLVSASLREHFQGQTPIRAAGAVSPGKGWRLNPLLQLARLESGHTPSRRHPEWWGGDVPWLALADIRKLHGKFVYETGENTNDAGLANSAARLLPVHTVCLSRTASVGFVSILGKPMATSQDFCNWVCGPNLDPEFLMFAMMASQDYLRELGSGAVHKTIYMPTIESFHVCAPKISEQRRIAHALRELLSAVDALNAVLSQRLAEIERLPQKLLAAAFDGIA